MAKKIEVQCPSWTAEMWDWPLQRQDGVVKVTNTADKFKVGLEMQAFKPDEIEVNLLEHDVMISCKHSDRTYKHGSVKREINRSYRLPDDVDMNTVKSDLGVDGILRITAEKLKK